MPKRPIPNIEPNIYYLITLIESAHEYQKWVQEIPFFSIPSDWEIRIIPPFGGAIIRFIIRRKGEDKEISVYLDCYDRLGSVGAPYWEIYPYKEDVIRLQMNDIKALIDTIDQCLGNKRVNLNKILTEKT